MKKQKTPILNETFHQIILAGKTLAELTPVLVDAIDPRCGCGGDKCIGTAWQLQIEDCSPVRICLPSVGWVFFIVEVYGDGAYWHLYIPFQDGNAKKFDAVVAELTSILNVGDLFAEDTLTNNPEEMAEGLHYLFKYRGLLPYRKREQEEKGQPVAFSA